MKALKLLVVVFFALKLNAQTTYPSGVSGCIARWNFTNSGGTITSLPDVSGNGHNGATYNLAPAAGFRNIPNVAMHFDGATSYADVPHDNQLNLQAFTIVALVKFDHFYSGPCQESQIIEKGYPNWVPGEYGLGVDDNFYDNSCSVFSPANQQMNYQIDTITTLNAGPGNYVSPNTWYFMAITFDNFEAMNTYQVVMDTADYHSSISPLLTYAGVTHGVDSNNFDVAIGTSGLSSIPYWLAGSLDELVLFNKALSASEIESVYTYLWGGSGLGIQEPSSVQNEGVKLFPNVNSGEFTVNGFIKSGNVSFEVVDYMGHLVYHENTIISNDFVNKKIVLDNNLPGGVYFMRINGEGNSDVKRFVVLK